MKLMLQNLLAKRFKLKLHRETRELPVFLLTVAKPDIGLKPSADQNAERRILPGSEGSLQAQNVTIAELAEMFSGPLQSPILDRTNLAGLFDFTLKNPPGPRDDVFASLTEAMRQQLGLKLVKQKVPIEMLIVDGAQQKPVAN